MGTLFDEAYMETVWKKEAARLDGILKANYEVTSKLVVAATAAKKLLEDVPCCPSCDSAVIAALELLRSVLDP
jgi:hypothetical protein